MTDKKVAARVGREAKVMWSVTGWQNAWAGRKIARAAPIGTNRSNRAGVRRGVVLMIGGRGLT